MTPGCPTNQILDQLEKRHPFGIWLAQIVKCKQICKSLLIFCESPLGNGTCLKEVGVTDLPWAKCLQAGVADFSFVFSSTVPAATQLSQGLVNVHVAVGPNRANGLRFAIHAPPRAFSAICARGSKGEP